MRTISVTALMALVGLLRTTQGAYTLQDDYSGSNFFTMFDFFTESDPTNGYVDYISQFSAQSAGLINTNNGQVYMGVDSKNVASGRGRQSVRVTSKAKYNHALIILDLDHMPGSICGTWPAFWTVGPNWPYSGEIDIIEGVNSQRTNAATLHTGAGCSVSQSSKRAQAFTGQLQTSNCDVKAAGQANNAGCGILSSDTSSYGDGFNSGKGGVYATEWTSNGISVWYFPRKSVPSNINSSPDPSSWGLPLASFGSSSCNIDNMFKDQQIVFDTTFCGDWAGNVWSSDPTCSAKANTCQDFVQNNPKAFADSYWSINSLKVFSSDGKSGANPKPSQGASSSKSAIPSVVPSATGAPQPSLCLYADCSPSTSSSSKPIVSSASSSGKPSISSATGAKPSIQSPSGQPVISSSKPTAVPTSFATSVQPSQSQAQPQPSSWTGWNQGGQGGGWTRTREWGPNASGQSRTWGGNVYGNYWGGPGARDIPAPTAYVSEPETTSNANTHQREPRSLPPPMVRAADPFDGVDLNLVRRHMATHAYPRRRLGDRL